ncbi:MAG: hypothetical protein DI587_17110 [Variovorax paradoxus]|nr:MAG: hypothetical protein DI583_17110 [Variovorax paradoxus]PZQ08954.1 MAG: hypothetical protein DI587_17110 [Variovorax paradoxus]
MQINIAHDIDEQIARLGGRLARVAGVTAQALNDTGFAVRAAEQRLVGDAFDRVTPYIVKSVLVEQATPDRLEVGVAAEYLGGKGVDPDRILAPHIDGGRRGDKASERALQRAGILPQGYQIVPGAGAPLDAFGNVQRGFVVKILSWFQAFGQQGYSANLTQAGRARRERRGRTAIGYRTMLGTGYFVAYGRLRDGKGSHLAPGIYSKTGIHGVDVKPLLMFVRRGNYSRTLEWGGVAQRTVAEAFPRRFRYRYRSAVEAQA